MGGEAGGESGVMSRQCCHELMAVGVAGHSLLQHKLTHKQL